MKIPKLTTIRFPAYLGSSSNELEDLNPKELCLNNITTACFDYEVIADYFEDQILENVKDWLIYILPNLKYFTYGRKKLPSIENELIPILNNKIQHLEITISFTNDAFERLIEQCYIYFSNVQYIYFRSEEFQSIFERKVNIFVEVLKNFKNFKAMLIYNLHENFSHWQGGMWNRFIRYAHLNEIKETFEVKIFDRYILLSKKNI